MSLGFCADNITYEELLSFVLIGLKIKIKKMNSFILCFRTGSLHFSRFDSQLVIAALNSAISTEVVYLRHCFGCYIAGAT